ncbi:hypothetical protein PSTT_10562, partial [Puccinia striiformis]
MGVPILPIWLLLTGLLGPIGESTCLSTYEDTFKFARMQTRYLLGERKSMCEAEEGPGGVLSLHQKTFLRPRAFLKSNVLCPTWIMHRKSQILIDCKNASEIAWKHPGTDNPKGGASHIRTGENLKHLEEKVFSHLDSLMHRKLRGFSTATEEKYYEQMVVLLSYLRKLPFEMVETTKEPHGLDVFASLKAGSEDDLSKIFQYFHDIYDIFKSNIKPGPQALDGCPDETVYQLMFGLIMNKEKWKKMVNLYLVMQIELQPFDDIFEKTVSKVDPSSQDTYHFIAKSAIKDLAGYTTSDPGYAQSWSQAVGWKLTRLKFKLNLIHYFIRFLVDHKGSGIIQELKREKFYPSLQGIDKSFKLLHDVLKLGKYKLDELRFLVDHEHLLNHPTLADSAEMGNIGEKGELASQMNPVRENLSSSSKQQLQSNQSKIITQRLYLLDQPIANKLDCLTYENLMIDHPSEVHETERISQLLNGDLAPGFEFASPLISQVKWIVKQFNFIAHSSESLFKKKYELESCLRNPFGLIKY